MNGLETGDQREMSNPILLNNEREGEAIADMIPLSNRYKNYFKLFLLFALYVTVCTIFYTYYENWQPSVALSFVADTITTVGYGYHHPSDDNSRLFTIFAMVFGALVIFTAFSTALTSRLAALTKTDNSLTDLEDAEAVFQALRLRVVANIMAVLIGLFTVATFFYWLEDWSYIKAFYFAVQTATSVGYGDIPLKQNGTHVIVGIYEFLSVVMLTFAVRNITDIYHERKRQAKMLTVAERKQMLGQIEELDTGNGVGEAEFVLAVLEQLGTIDRARDVEPWIKKFRALDVNRSGVIRKSEIAMFSAAETAEGQEAANRIRHLQATKGLGSFDLGRSMRLTFGARPSVMGARGSMMTTTGPGLLAALWGGSRDHSFASSRFGSSLSQQHPGAGPTASPGSGPASYSPPATSPTASPLMGAEVRQSPSGPRLSDLHP